MENTDIDTTIPLVTVFCAVYNHEKYVGDALEGFVRQKTSFPFEILVHDDASTDSSAEIILRYSRRYPNIIPMIERENQYSIGSGFMRKSMLPRARGKYIAFCEGDDYWIDDSKLQKQIDYLEAHPECSACAHNSIRHNVLDGSNTLMYSNETFDLSLRDVIVKGGAYWQLASFVCRRSVFEDWPGFLLQCRGAGDYRLAINACLQGGVHYMGCAMSVYRFLTNGSWSMRCRKDTKLLVSTYGNIVNLLESLNQYTEGKYSSLIAGLILRNKYLIEESRFNFRVLSKGDFKQIYKEHSVSYRIKVKLKMLFKPLYLFYRKLH